MPKEIDVMLHVPDTKQIRESITRLDRSGETHTSISLVKLGYIADFIDFQHNKIIELLAEKLLAATGGGK